MHFHNKTFENTYLKLIFEQTEEGVQFKYICKDCNTGFAEEDGFAEGDACPCEDCDGKLEECVIDDLDPNNMPAQYSADNQNDSAEDENEDAMETSTEDEALVEGDEMDFEDEDDFQDEDLCDDQDEDFQDDDFQDDDLCDDQDEDFQDDDFQDDDDEEDFQDDYEAIEDYQDEQSDDDAAEEDEDDEDDADQNESDDKDDDEQAEIKLVSFTAKDPALIQLLNQVQNGEVKLVAVPPDFEFEEKEMNELPAITMDTVDNFAIDDMNEQQENEEAEGEDKDEAEGEDEGEDDGEEQKIAKEARKKFITVSKPTKYGIY